MDHGTTDEQPGEHRGDEQEIQSQGAAADQANAAAISATALSTPAGTIPGVIAVASASTATALATVAGTQAHQGSASDASTVTALSTVSSGGYTGTVANATSTTALSSVTVDIPAAVIPTGGAGGSLQTSAFVQRNRTVSPIEQETRNDTVPPEQDAEALAVKAANDLAIEAIGQALRSSVQSDAATAIDQAMRKQHAQAIEAIRRDDNQQRAAILTALLML